jgi:chorismate-pyruvate lyase
MKVAAEDGGAVARAESLVRLFHQSPASFAALTAVSSDAVPQPYRGLLDHRSHMTAAMERHHGGPVSLRVVAHDGPRTEADGREWYAREILLSNEAGDVVQYGIVRIDLSSLGTADAARVRNATAPLGRILMAAGVLCDVRDVSLVAVHPGDELRRLIGDRATFGRVALIRVDGSPAIELLEIVVDSRGG